MRWKKLVLISVVVATISVVVIGYFVNFAIYDITDVSVEEVVSDPYSFDGVHVRLRGYVMDTSVYMFGPKYMLMGDEGSEIALGGKDEPVNVDLELYVNFILDGENYTRIRNLKVIVVGYVRYVGPVTDVPPCYLDVETVKEANTVTKDVAAAEISKKAELVREGLTTSDGFIAEASFHNYSWVKHMKKGHAREIYERVPEGHDIWEMLWIFLHGVEDYSVIVIVDAETGTIIHETKGVRFG